MKDRSSTAASTAASLFSVRARITGLLVLVLAGCASTSANPPPSEPWAQQALAGDAGVSSGPARAFAGTYVSTPAPGEAEQLAQAIEQAVANMGIMAGMARAKLQERLTPVATLAITSQDNEVGIVGRQAMRATMNTVAHVQGPRGNVDVLYEMADAMLVQTLTFDSATIRTTYSLTSDAKVLTVHVTLTSARLGAPISIDRTYTRR